MPLLPELAGIPSNSDADVPHLLKDIALLVPEGKFAVRQSEAAIGTDANVFRFAAFDVDTPDMIDCCSASPPMLDVFDTVHEKRII